MSPLDAVLLSLASPVSAVVLGFWSERRRRAREACLAVCLQHRRDEADRQIDLHYSALPDFVNGDTNV